MFKLINILNPLTGGSTTQECELVKGEPLAHYVGYRGSGIITCNGEVIDLPLDEIYPAYGEEYSVMLIPEGGDAQTMRLLGYVGLTVAMGFFPGAPAAAGFMTRFASGAARAGMWYAGMTLLQLIKDKEPDQSTSQSYSWQHKESLTAAHGLAMPVVYGKTRVRPTIKNRYVTVEGDKQRLYALFGVTGHKVDEINTNAPDTAKLITAGGGPYYYGDIGYYVDMPGKTYRCIIPSGTLFPMGYWEVWHGSASFHEDIVVDGRAITDYNADVEWETRPGLATQAMISGFDVTYASYTQDTALYLDFPEVNKNTANLYWSGGFLYWSDHYILYKGESYHIPKGSIKATAQSGNETQWACWKPNQIFYSIGHDEVLTGYYGLAYYKPGVNKDPKYTSHTEMPADPDWTTPSQTFSDCHNIELMYEFHNGLYGYNQGVVRANCRFFAQYRTVDVTGGVTTYGDWTNFAFPAFDKPEGKGDYANVDDATGVNVGYISRKKPELFHISVQAVKDIDENLLDSTLDYQIRTTASSSCLVKLVHMSAITYGERDEDGIRRGFTYPGESLLGIKALASGQVSGDIDVQVDVERSLVWVYNPNSTAGYKWEQKAANNHAWAVYDILVNGFYHTSYALCHPTYPYSYMSGGTRAFNTLSEAVYGCGVNPTYIDYDSFEAWADYIDSPLGYELNIVFDTFMTAWDAILRICQEGRGMVYPMGAKIYAYVDRDADMSQVFTMGSINTDTFARKFMSGKNKANMVETTFYDAENNYTKTVAAARTANWESTSELNTPTSLTLYGTTSFEQAMSLAWYALKANELLNNTITFGVDVDALAVRAGDVVGVGHDVMGTGSSGRVTAYVDIPPERPFVILDRNVTALVTRSYTLTVKCSATGVTETRAVIPSGGTTNYVQITSPFSFYPDRYDVYSFGLAGQHLPLYRVTDISRTSELMRTLTLIKYDATLYGEWTPGDGSEFPMSKTAVGPVANLLNLASNLQLKENISLNRTTGEYESSVTATWDTVDGDPRGAWELWFRPVDASDIDWEGEWEDGVTYELGDKVEKDGVVYVSLVDDNDQEPFYIT